MVSRYVSPSSSTTAFPLLYVVIKLKIKKLFETFAERKVGGKVGVRNSTTLKI
jgi:hypothetical protein